MSIYSMRRLTGEPNGQGDVLQPLLVEGGVFAGSVACQSTDRHYAKGTSRTYRYRAEAIPAPAANGVFIEWNSSSKERVDYITFACPEHGRPIKANITRGNWAGRDTEWVEGVTPDEVVKMGVREFIEARTKMEKMSRDAAKARYEAQQLAHVREHWAAKRARYNATEFGSNREEKQVHYNASLSEPDEYGRTFVVTVRADMTPTEARDYAQRLLALADKAADQTAVAVKP